MIKFNLAAGFAWFIFAQSSYANEMVKMIHADSSTVKAVLEATLNGPNKTDSQSVRIVAVNTLPLQHVVAVQKDGEKIIIINVGTYLRLRELSAALLASKYLIKEDKYLPGYVRYLGYADLFGGELLSADDFAAIYLGGEIRTKFADMMRSKETEDNAIFSNLLAFVIAHEVAHHVLSHTTDTQVTSKEKREREEAADKWAAEHLLRAGFMPLGSVAVMLMFNELHERTEVIGENSSHPAPISRALYLSDTMIEMLEKIVILGQKNVSPYPLSTLSSALVNAKRMATLVSEQAKHQRRLADVTTLVEDANKGNRFAQLRLGELYSNGKSREVKYDPFKAREMYRKAADNTEAFEYLDQADADSRTGWMYAFMPTKLSTDFELACFYLKRSADAKYDQSVWAFHKLKSDGKCSEY